MDNSPPPNLPPRLPPIVGQAPPLWHSPGAVPPPLPPPRKKSRLVEWLGSLGIIGTLLLTVGGKLKFLLPLLKFIGPVLKTGGTMLLSIGVYALAFGWKFAVGFVLLIFVHEMGHVFAARLAGVPVTAPTFIPFVGALIRLKQSPQSAWVEAKIAYGGPIAGAWASALCHWVWLETDNPFWAALAWIGYMLNLFNLVPAGFLDGGRIVTAISPWLWLIGYLVLGGWLGWDLYRLATGTGRLGTGTFVMAFIFIEGLPRLFSLFRRRTEAEQRYFSVTSGQRVGMALAYFGLIGALAWGMTLTHVDPAGLR